MPIFDFPLKKLRVYRGRNPRPADIESYWDQALREMRAVEPKVELVPSEFQTCFAECFDLYFTGVRNARIHAKYIRPKGARKPHPAVLCFHGYSGNAGDWVDRLAYAGMGFSVALMDCRGQGGSSEDTGGAKGTTYRGHIIRGLDDPDPQQLLFRHIYLDTAQLAGIVMQMPEVDPRRVGVTGISQGGGLTLACAALEPRIKRAAPTFPFLCDYQRVWEMDLAASAYEELRTFFRQFDPQHLREKAIWTKLGYIDVQHLAHRIRAKVLFATSLMDTVCPPSTQFAAYNKIRSPKTMVIYPDYAHESLPGYQDLVFQFMAPL
jgi:cephalosporin-C deacetylase